MPSAAPPSISKKPYSAGQVANYLLDLAERDGVSVSPMKLQKLVYFAFGWGLVLKDIALFTEPIQAWEHGPVIPSLYHEFKVFGWQPIKGRSFHLRPDGSTVVRSIPLKDRAARKAVSWAWEAYGQFSAAELRRLTHAEGTPWSEIKKQDMLETEIPVEAIRIHFLKKRRDFYD